MRVLCPEIEFRTHGEELAARPESLSGKTVGFLDGWGRRCEDGSFDLYPLMAELRQLLADEQGIRGSVWLHKPSISKPLDGDDLAAFAARVDVVVNGECI